MSQDDRPRDRLGRYTNVDNNIALMNDQLSKSGKEQKKLNNPFNPEDYSTKGEELYTMAQQADYVHNHEGADLHTIESGNNKGFVAYTDKPERIIIENLGSTGGNLGRQLLGHVADQALQSNKGLYWMSTKSSDSYYSHIGLDDYRIDKSNSYWVKSHQVADFKKRLKL